MHVFVYFYSSILICDRENIFGHNGLAMIVLMRKLKNQVLYCNDIYATIQVKGAGSDGENSDIHLQFFGGKLPFSAASRINHGILPALFTNPADYDKLEPRSELSLKSFPAQLRAKGVSFSCKIDLTDAKADVVPAGGQLKYLRSQIKD